jgi:hypothetical protein
MHNRMKLMSIAAAAQTAAIARTAPTHLGTAGMIKIQMPIRDVVNGVATHQTRRTDATVADHMIHAQSVELNEVPNGSQVSRSS